MRRLIRYLTDPTIHPATQTCRLKVWAHDNAFTAFVVVGTSMVGWIVTVVVCH